MIQLQFINYLLQTKDSSLITANNLTSDYFSDYKQQFNYILKHLEVYGNIPDKATFLSAFDSFELIEVNETPAYLINELLKDYQSRKLAEGFNKIRTLLMSGKTDEAISYYQSISETLTTGVSFSCVDILRDTSRYDDYVDRTQNFDKYYVTTGFKELDKIIGGWDRDEELATIVARTNVGKSYVMFKCALAAAEAGLTVGIYEGEMKARKVGYRIDTLLSHISNGALTHGNISVMNEYKRFIDDLPNRVPGKLKVLTPDMIGGPAGVGALRAFIEKEHLDILFVDQHSLLEDDRKAKAQVEKASNISKDLKNLQVMKRIPIISVSQQNRTTTESGNQDTTQIAQTDRIGQDSTAVIFLERKDNILKMHLVKSRDSENNKTLSYNVDFNTGVFTFIPDETTEGLLDISTDDFEDRYNIPGDASEVF